jgi:cobalamin biosynthesis protein CobT
MVRKIRASSLRDTLRLTVRLLTKSNVNVQFRGHIPMVITKGGKVDRLVLPEISDTASPELLKAIQGFLDHEVGHILYTPFLQQQNFCAGVSLLSSVLNMVEDIRLEKLMPRDLPGTKLNLQRMYESSIPMMFLPSIEKAEKGGNSSDIQSALIVVALRALAGQLEFQQVMDLKNRWAHFDPLINLLPSLSNRLLAMESSVDAETLAKDIYDAIKSLSPPPPAPGDDGDDDAPGDDGDDDAPGDDGDDDAPGDDGDDDAPGDDGDDDAPGGKKPKTLNQALKSLQPAQRRALFLYKKRKMSVAEIGSEMNLDHNAVENLLREARRGLANLMKGDDA